MCRKTWAAWRRVKTRYCWVGPTAEIPSACCILRKGRKKNLQKEKPSPRKTFTTKGTKGNTKEALRKALREPRVGGSLFLSKVGLGLRRLGRSHGYFSASIA